jgi:hypothetical protein
MGQESGCTSCIAFYRLHCLVSMYYKHEQNEKNSESESEGKLQTSLVKAKGNRQGKVKILNGIMIGIIN